MSTPQAAFPPDFGPQWLLRSIGEIVTFYSYKGGTGRSMALVNCAGLIEKHLPDGVKPVLVIDFDLEAPGLHRYLTRFLPPEHEWISRPGTIDLFEELRDRVQEHLDASRPEHAVNGRLDDETVETIINALDLERYIIHANLDRLVFIKSGCFDDDTYSRRVSRFNWEELFDKAPALFRCLALRLSREFSYVLVDSRTGLSDTSNICTMLLPDVMVVVFTPNQQSLSGIDHVVRRAATYREQSSELRLLRVYPLPSRVDTSHEDFRRVWRMGSPSHPPFGRVDGYQPMFTDLFANALGMPATESSNVSEYFDAVQVPHSADYAYGERVCFTADSSKDRLSVREGYEKLLTWLATGAQPWQRPGAVLLTQQAERLLSSVGADDIPGPADLWPGWFERLGALLERRSEPPLARAMELPSELQSQLGLVQALAWAYRGDLGDLGRSTDLLREIKPRLEETPNTSPGPVLAGLPALIRMWARHRPSSRRAASDRREWVRVADELISVSNSSRRVRDEWFAAQGDFGLSEQAGGAQLGRVFVSSVFGGMSDVRRRLVEAARALGFGPVMSEDLVAESHDVASALDREIGNCATYVGLFSKRRGTVPGGEQWAIAEQEFLLAGRWGLRRLVLLDRGADAERDEGLRLFLADHVHPFGRDVYPMPYTSEDELRLGMTAAMSALRPEVVLSIERGGAGLEGRLFVSAMQPALGGDVDEVGPFDVTVALGESASAAAEMFLAGPRERDALPGDALRLVGAELYAKLAKACGVFARCLLLCDAAGLPLLLRVRSRESEVLALPWELIHLPEYSLPARQGLLEVIRQIPPEGTDRGPNGDPVPRLPARELAVLGFTSDPVEDEAAEVGPSGIVDSRKLFWEVEQERLLLALEPLLSENRGRLVLPDTGDRAVLAEELARGTRPTILHLSGHGALKDFEGRSRQVIYLEDEDGHRTAATSEDLLGWIRAPADLEPPSLVVLSGCTTPSLGARVLTAGGAHQDGVPSGHGPVRSLAEDLVRGGLPRVLGMQTSISDAGATEFAGAFYAALARGTDLVVALRDGRAALRDRGGAHEWAIPVLFTQDHLGPLVAPPDQRRRVETPLERTRSAFDIGNVTYREHGYVGRRIFDRRLHRAWREGARLIAIQGFAGIGKSTVAARFLERRASEGVRVLVLPPGGRLTGTLLDDVADLVGVARSAQQDPARAETIFRQALTRELRQTPTTLLFDNFEDNQDPATGRLTDAAFGAALLDLATLGGPAVRLLFTTRYELTLPPGPLTVRNLDLGELSRAESLKLKVLLGLKVSEADWRRIIESIGGHPKALELLAGYLQGSADRLPSLLRRFDRAIEHVSAALSAERQEHGGGLLIDAVLDEVPAARLPALDRLCLLVAPLPTPELADLLRSDGVADPEDDIGWLRAHGLLAQTAAPSALEGGDAVHRLIASRRGIALASREGEDAAHAFHRKASAHFVARRGPLGDLGLAAAQLDVAGDRAGALELWERWAIALRDAHAYRAAVQVAARGLTEKPLDDSDACRIAAANLHLTTCDCLVPLGELAVADAALDAAATLLFGLDTREAVVASARVLLLRADRCQQRGQPEQARAAYRDAGRHLARVGRRREGAIALSGEARLKAQAGDVQGAMTLHEEILEIFQELGDVRSRAVTLGDIARLKAQAGDLQSAITLFQEKLQVAQQLGDVRSRAVTLGDIARLKAQAGDVQSAMTLYEEMLGIFQQLGDVRERAVTLGDIARLKAQAGDVQGAITLFQEKLQVAQQLGDVRSRAVALGDIARLKAQAGDVQGAMALYEEMLGVFQQLGDVRSRAVALGDIARLKAQVGDVEGAMTLQEEMLGIFQQLGDVRERAVTLGDIARLKVQAGDVQGAMTLHEEMLGIFQQLGDVRSRAVALGNIAWLKAQAGEIPGARRLQEERLDVNRRIGDVDGIAATLFDLSRLDLGEQNIVVAASKLAEAWPLLLQLGRVDGIAVVGELYGQILAATKDPHAREVLEQSQRAWTILGDTERAQQIAGLSEGLS